MLFEDAALPSAGDSLVGIARLARQGEPLEAKARVTYKELPTRSYITRCSSPRMPFAFTINPYRGCEFGCKYCYARYTHEFIELRDSHQFENEIFAKQWDAARFAAEVRRIPRGEHVAIGTATDPYQPAERRYGITRKMLGALANRGGLHLGITTKSDLVVRDAQLLAMLARRHVVHVHVTITTLDAQIARLLEPRAPRPDLRLSAIKTLADAGVAVGVFCSPILPFLNDGPEQLTAVALEAKRHGASHFWGAPVFLKTCAAKVFLPFVKERFPQFAEMYQRTFGGHDSPPERYRQRVREAVEQAREAAGLASRPSEYLPPEWSAGQQLSLLDSPM